MARSKAKKEKSARALAAEAARLEERRQRIKKANKVCEELGISSYTHYGNNIYQKALRMCGTKNVATIVEFLRKDSQLEIARRENAPEIYIHPLKEEYLGDENAASLRLENEARWQAAVKAKPSKGLTFGSTLQRPKAKDKEKAPAPAPVVEVVAPVVVPAPAATPTLELHSVNPAPAPSGLLVAGQKPKAAAPIDGLPDVIRARIPGGLIPAFRQFVVDELGNGYTAEELAERFLLKHGPVPSVTEQATISVADVKPATVEEVKPAQLKPTPIKPVSQHVDVTDYTAIATSEEVSTQSQRNAAAQAAFRDAVMANCHGRCLVSGKSYQRAIQACHIQPHAKGGRMQVCNGLVLETSLHDVFDAGDMAIHPVTLRVYFSRAALDGGFSEYHGKVIGETMIALGTAELVARWESFTAIHDLSIELA